MFESLKELRSALRASAKPEDAAILQRFFKTGPGEYGEGDVFLGVRVPAIRKLVRQTDALAERAVLELLPSRFHEERLLALLIFVRRFARGDEKQRQRVYALYLENTSRINNWDLVDLSAPNIVGAWLLTRSRAILRALAASKNLWERRIAILATFTFIRAGQFDDTLALCRLLMGDRQDLLHKACGWMLREMGKRSLPALTGFLDQHAPRLPRTMLRYAIERLPEPQRQDYLAMGR